MKIIIEKNGNLRMIYDDAFASLLKEGVSTIKRASHVEPINDKSGKWQADLSPVGGDVLGPFDTRKEALAAEVQWLNDNNIPKPG